MTPKTNPQNCETGHCDDHSGLMIWIKGMTFLLSMATALLSYSVLWQAPNIRLDIAREIARLDAKDSAVEYRIQTIERDHAEIGRRVTMLETK